MPVQVLSLDTCVKRQLAGMRRDLFRLIGVGEFSAEASWTAPHLCRDGGTARSLLVYLPEVACPQCNFTRDIDVCRDRRLVDVAVGGGGGGVEQHHWAWACSHCRAMYPRGGLEEALVQQLEQIALQHSLQVGGGWCVFHHSAWPGIGLSLSGWGRSLCPRFSTKAQMIGTRSRAVKIVCGSDWLI